MINDNKKIVFAILGRKNKIKKDNMWKKKIALLILIQYKTKNNKTERKISFVKIVTIDFIYCEINIYKIRNEINKDKI